MARASLIYSESSTSSIADRIRRILAATKNHPRVMEGRIKLFQSCRPDGGTHSTLRANRKISIIPSQNGGIDCPAGLPIYLRCPQTLFRLSDESIPQGDAQDN